jgi:hypothetical protein
LNNGLPLFTVLYVATRKLIEALAGLNNSTSSSCTTQQAAEKELNESIKRAHIALRWSSGVSGLLSNAVVTVILTDYELLSMFASPEHAIRFTFALFLLKHEY